MSQRTWKSLNARILLLAAVTCLFLAASAISFISYLRHSQAASISASERHLVSVAAALAHNYEDHASASDLLGAGQTEGADELPEGPPPPPDPDSLKSLPSPPSLPLPPLAHAAGPLTRLTASVLSREEGVEGGFYLAATHSLAGYAFPTHEGPSPTKELPQREKPTILRLAQQAADSNSVQTFQFEGPHDAVLFVAAPVKAASKPNGAVKTSTGATIGAVWLMQRIPGFNGAQNRQLLLTSLGFGTAALITAFLAFFVMNEVRGGVHVVLERLQSLEAGFDKKQEPQTAKPLKEFRDVLDGVDRLALSLAQKIEKEKMLEAELRHRERLSALGQFAAGVAHELRNPLATIRLRTQMSQRSATGEEIARNSVVVMEEVDRLDTMIERLLYFAKPITLATEPVSLAALCREVVAGWQDRAAPVEVLCSTNTDVEFECDRSRLVQVLDNLIENAVESAASARGASGRVEVIAEQLDDAIRLTVQDNGQGFSETALKHALDPFFTTRESGTGLGLSIASELVQAHGSHLEYRNRPEGGAAISAVFPFAGVANRRGLNPVVAHG